ncbi:hypothetical protein DFH28DRAFT_1078555 [Melampsora americana]|nr:hypothetical protein DFH28DRAFT_1078555 [Melampsora americana]
MPNRPYIGTKYRRVPLHQPLPRPKHGGKVGLACPECSNNVSLVYVESTEDTVKVKCPTVRNHYYRTFKLNQLFHEIERINAGDTYPIPFDEAAHGPPVNIKGEVLPPRVTRSKAKTQSQANSDAKAPRAPPAIKCARPKDGPTSAKHKPGGHAGCTSKYCKSVCPSFQYCCIAYGVECHAHRQKNTPARQPPAPLVTPPRVHTPPPAPAPKTAKRPRILQAQCAQSIRRVGRLLPDESVAILERARETQANRGQQPNPEAQSVADLVSTLAFDEEKVASLHLVTHEQRHPVISHLFQHWPLAKLEDCPSLMRKAQAAAGPTWDETLLFWDDQLRSWHEIPVSLPHRFTNKNLVICIPSQHVALTNQLQDILEGLGMGKPLVRKPINVPKPPGAMTSNQVVGVTPKPCQPVSNIDAVNTSAHINLVSDTESESESLEPQSKPSARNYKGYPSTPDSHSAFFSELPEGQPPPAPPAVAVPLQVWPGEDVTLASLLEWFSASPERGTRIPQWFQRFGTTHRFNEKTVYRYWAFVDEVKYPRFKKWHEEWPLTGDINRSNITVSRARRTFQREFNAVSGVKEPNKDKPCRGHTGSYAINFTHPEALGWRALPFDKPQNDTDDLVFGLVPSGGLVDNPQEVLTYKWGFRHVTVEVDQGSYFSIHDSRYTHSAIVHRHSGDIVLDAVSLPLHQDNIWQHLRFAQMFAYAKCLLQEFKTVLQERVDLTAAEQKIVQDLRGLGTPLRWFNLRETTKKVPKYITSEDGFAPTDRASTVVASLMACFTHWTYDHHGGKALVCGFRGWNCVITDLIIMDDERPWFLQNNFTGGLQSFSRTHVCEGLMCEKVGLKPPRPYYHEHLETASR